MIIDDIHIKSENKMTKSKTKYFVFMALSYQKLF